MILVVLDTDCDLHAVGETISSEASMIAVAMFAFEMLLFGSLSAARKAGKISCTQSAILVAGSGC